jgi:hypothetical protein
MPGWLGSSFAPTLPLSPGRLLSKPGAASFEASLTGGLASKPVPDSLLASGPVSGAPASGVLHEPTVVSCELQISPTGHPFPPVPRHPSSQTFLASSHTLPLVVLPQSESVWQLPQVPSGAQMVDRQSLFEVQPPPVGWPHVWSVGSQMPDWHCAFVVHEAPLGRPQRLVAVSQTADRQTRWPFAVVQMPLTGGTFGTGCPFGVLGMQTLWAHHRVEVQSLSEKHAVPQPPVVVLQIPPEWPVQSVFDVHLPQAPVDVQ